MSDQCRVIKSAQVKQVFQIVDARRLSASRDEIRLQILFRALMTMIADDVGHRLFATAIERGRAAIIRFRFGQPFVNERRADKAPSPG